MYEAHSHARRTDTDPHTHARKHTHTHTCNHPQLLKSRNFLPMEECKPLFDELTGLDEQRAEIGEEEFEKRLTEVIRNTLKRINEGPSLDGVQE